MKLLWIKAGGLVPLDTGGKIRSFHILKELARKHQVTLYTYYGEHTDDTHPRLSDLFTRVICRPLKIPPLRSLANYANYSREFFSSHPHSLCRFFRPEIAEEIRGLIESEEHDVIICDFLSTARVIPWEISGLKVIFTHNVEAAIYRRQYHTTRQLIWKIVAWREFQATSRAERRYLKQADHVLTVSDIDREAFTRIVDSAKITTIPTGVDAQYYQPSADACLHDSLVFSGSMDWMPNEDAMLYFVDKILPLIRRRVPAVSVSIVGRRPSARLQALAAADEMITITGGVEDIRPYVQKAAVYIVPLRIGGGTRIKIFEAMAMGKAIVSTTIGVEGLPVQDGVNVRIGDTPEEFAERVTGLLCDPDARTALGEVARQFVEQRFGWAAAAACFESMLDQLMAKRAADTKSIAKSQDIFDISSFNSQVTPRNRC